MTLHVIYSILWARIVNLYYFTSENSSLTTMVACAIYFISVSNICANVIWNLVMLKRFIWKLWFFSGDILSISINWLICYFSTWILSRGMIHAADPLGGERLGCCCCMLLVHHFSLCPHLCPSDFYYMRVFVDFIFIP